VLNTPTWLNTVHHDGSTFYVSNPYPRLGEKVQLRLRVGANAPIRRAFLRTFPDGEQAFTEMKAGSVEPPVRWWLVDLPMTQPTVNYRFILEADDGAWMYSAAGPSIQEPLDFFDFRLLADYTPPVWIFDSVFYQIFPDRFANGDPANDPQPEEYEYRGHRPRTFPWGALPPESQPFPIVFYGGDLQGITERLDYLQELGVNALYLNPIFSAYSNHKYDVADYEHVDVHLGGDEALAELRLALDERGMRYILDIVPNHAGYWHPWFQAARADPQAQEAEFFTFNRHPNDYASWLGVWSLPKLNYRSPELRRRIYAGPQAIFRHWLRSPYLADGWRIDVANMLGRQGDTQIGEEIARGIRQAVKETNSQAYLIGENFFDASPQLQGDQWDGVMNYAGFRKPLLHWLCGYNQKAHGLPDGIHSPVPWPTDALASTWLERLAAIPWPVALQQFNLLDSHDTPRIRSILDGNDALHRLVVLVMFTFPGVPCVYYGDEIGMLDIPSLESRGCMVWDKKAWDQSLLAYYQELIGLRRASAVLQQGSFQILAVETDLIAYQRANASGRFLVVAQRSAETRPSNSLSLAHGGIADGTRFLERFSGIERVVENGALAFPELPQGGTLWEQL
jgi:alpha-glucosidase